MRKLPFCLLVFVLTLTAANFKLYLKDGSFQIIREYSVDGDRVKYYSIERSDWEEIPAELIDLKRTETEMGARKEVLKKEEQAGADEKGAAREQRRDILKIPRDPGVYQLDDDRKLRIFKAAEGTVHSEKGRNALKAMAPVPIFAGKATLEIPGEHASEAVRGNSAEFYLQLSAFEGFGIVELTPKKGVRIVERISIQPGTKENMEERLTIPVFTKQLSDNGLYKIWPQDPLPPGEYAVIEYTDGKINTQVWDFRVE